MIEDRIWRPAGAACPIHHDPVIGQLGALAGINSEPPRSQLQGFDDLRLKDVCEPPTADALEDLAKDEPRTIRVVPGGLARDPVGFKW